MVMKLDHDDLNRLIEKISSSDIQEFSLEGEDFKLEIKRNLFNNNQSSNNYLATQNSLEKQQIITTQNSSSDNIALANKAETVQVPPQILLKSPRLWLAPFTGLQLLVRSHSLN